MDNGISHENVIFRSPVAARLQKAKMMMHRYCAVRNKILAGAFAAAMLVPMTTAMAQSAENSAPPSHELASGFVASFAMPTRRIGKIPRWQDGVCPITAGLRTGATDFISKRIRETAAKVGAPVNTDPACKPNIDVIFTTTPQALVDEMRKKQEVYLGYADNAEQMDRLATVSRAIQGWYTTQTTELRGKSVIDASNGAKNSQTPCAGSGCFSAGSAGAVTGSRLSNGLHSTFNHIVIVADPSKLADQEIGALADYISLLALTQVKSPDTCQKLSSIINLTVTGCTPRPAALTVNDAAYLRGVYRMSQDQTLSVQQEGIVSEMAKAP